MKKAILMLLAATMIAATATAQNDPISIDLARRKQDTANSILSQFKAKNTYVSLVLTAGNIQTISAHKDTVTGKLLTVITASRLDTVKLKRSLYSAGQVLEFVCTASANDSTKFLPDAGTINGASTYWFTGTYKAMKLYFDGTNYFILNKQ